MLKNIYNLYPIYTSVPFLSRTLIDKYCKLCSTKWIIRHFGSVGNTNDENTTQQRKHKNPFAQDNSTFVEELQPVKPYVQSEKQDITESARKGNSFLTNTANKDPAQIEILSPEERDKRLKILQLEVDIGYQEGKRVPTLEFFEDHHWEHILTLPTKSSRFKYYSYLWQIAMKKKSKQRKKEEKAQETEQHKEELKKQREENTHIIYGLGQTSLFLRVYDSTINHWQNNRLTRAMQFSPKIVLDCSYDQHMNQREAKNAAKQLTLCFAENRAHDDPFDMHYCNVDFNTASIKSLHRYIPTMLEPEFPMNVHEKCFTEIFPKENLVYLTPHCRTDLQVYNPDDVYIIGAMVDTVNNEPLSLAKAKRLGIRMARLPLDQYLLWGSGSGKSLTLNQMVNIMLDIKKTGDWNIALNHVPKRKILDIQTERIKYQQKMETQRKKFSFRVDKLLLSKDYDMNEPYTSPVRRKVRSNKDELQFNLDTWGENKKKTRNSQ